MQIMLDTATDAPTDLYRIGKYLVDNYSTFPVAPQDAAPLPPVIHAYGDSSTFGQRDIPAPPATLDDVAAASGLERLPASPAFAAVLSDDDVEVEIDEPGNVSALTMSVSLPPPPPAALPAPPGPAVAPALDSRGVPWDARIHASNRATKIGGAWKNRRGVDAALVAQIEGVPGNMPVPTLPAASPLPAAPSVASVPVPQFTAPAPLPPPPPIPAALVAATPTAAAPVPASIDFRGLMQKIATAQSAGKLTDAQVSGAMASVGLNLQDMAQLINNAPLIASVNAAVEACLTP
jgi:hypothetical protein